MDGKAIPGNAAHDAAGALSTHALFADRIIALTDTTRATCGASGRSIRMIYCGYPRTINPDSQEQR